MAHPFFHADDEAIELFRPGACQQEEADSADRFPAGMKANMPWPGLVAAPLPYYPKRDGPGARRSDHPKLTTSAFP
ncbi:hypothetical protein [Massilia suwonensis]|uniref:hypothetical protein n=1 Tax=Massilia suwonensis TaxID=648895 RepID=UPI0036D35CF2